MKESYSKENFSSPDEISEGLKEIILEINKFIEEEKEFLKGAEADLEFFEKNRDSDIEAGIDEKKVDDEIIKQKKHVEEVRGGLDELENLKAKAISGILRAGVLKEEMDKILIKMNEPQDKKHIQ